MVFKDIVDLKQLGVNHLISRFDLLLNFLFVLITAQVIALAIHVLEVLLPSTYHVVPLKPFHPLEARMQTQTVPCILRCIFTYLAVADATHPTVFSLIGYHVEIC